MNMRKLFAGVAAAATLLGGLALGATTANAKEGEVHDVNQTENYSLTIKGTEASVNGHEFSAIALGYYDQWVEGRNGKVASVSVATRDGAFVNTNGPLYNDLGKILKNVDEDANEPGVQNGYETSEYKNNPIGYVAAHYLGYVARDNHGNLDITSAKAPYEGALRQFVTQVASLASTELKQRGWKTTGENGVATFTDLPRQGLYLIVDQTTGDVINAAGKYSASIPMLVGTKIEGRDLEMQTLGEVEVKNQLPTIDKKTSSDGKNWAESTDAKIGDKVDYQISGKVPATAGYSTYTYKISDTLSKGLTLRDKASDKDIDYTGIVVTATKADGEAPEDLVEGADYTVTVSSNEDGTTGLVVDLSASIKSLAYDTDIVVTYSAVLNQNAVVGNAGNANSAKLEYSNNPGTNGTGESTPDTPKVYTYQFDFTKTDVSEQEFLNGAVFQVFVKGGKEPIKFVKDNSGNPNAVGQYFVAQDQNATVDNETVFDELTTQMVAGQNGKLWVGGLDAGTYEVKEIKAPAGYMQNVVVLPKFEVTISAPAPKPGEETAEGSPDGTWKVAFSKDGLWNLVDTNKGVVKNAKNLTQLPQTGAAGIAMFTVIAALLAGAAATVYGKSRKASAALRA